MSMDHFLSRSYLHSWLASTFWYGLTQESTTSLFSVCLGFSGPRTNDLWRLVPELNVLTQLDHRQFFEVIHDYFYLTFSDYVPFSADSFHFICRSMLCFLAFIYYHRFSEYFSYYLAPCMAWICGYRCVWSSPFLVSFLTLLAYQKYRETLCLWYETCWGKAVVSSIISLCDLAIQILQFTDFWMGYVIHLFALVIRIEPNAPLHFNQRSIL